MCSDGRIRGFATMVPVITNPVGVTVSVEIEEGEGQLLKRYLSYLLNDTVQLDILVQK